MVPWCSVYHYCTTSFDKTWTQFLCRFKSCMLCVGDSHRWGSLTVVPPENKTKHLSSVNHTTKTIFFCPKIILQKNFYDEFFYSVFAFLTQFRCVWGTSKSLIFINFFWYISTPQILTSVKSSPIRKKDESGELNKMEVILIKLNLLSLSNNFFKCILSLKF